jgi:hypothetical protein
VANTFCLLARLQALSPNPLNPARALQAQDMFHHAFECSMLFQDIQLPSTYGEINYPIHNLTYFSDVASRGLGFCNVPKDDLIRLGLNIRMRA